MRTESIVLLVIAAFFALAAGIYWFWGFGLLGANSGLHEQSGTAMLIASALLGLLPGGYYFWWSKRMPPRPEDRKDATMEDGAGVIGSFPSSSVWPFVLGLAAALVGLALVFGFWTAIVGFFVGISAVIGIIVESRRGGVV
ncbi:MAG TPA: cytochrome c oxidase subunit 4 [Acidimicrobiales bacterium]|nr:cytochrome c oxidase subunit 4 [Acidimicrobiales bacterium]